jgi:archaellum biogenesis ATPase FlaH
VEVESISFKMNYWTSFAQVKEMEELHMSNPSTKSSDRESEGIDKLDNIFTDEELKIVDQPKKNTTIKEKAKVRNEVCATKLLSSGTEKIPCLIEPFLQKVGLACLAGSSDTGKSSLLRQLAISVAKGDDDFIGFKINDNSRSVIYVSTEDLEPETAYLLFRQTTNINSSELENLRFMFELENLKDDLDNNLTIKPASLVIIDCFSDAYGGDLKDTQKIRTFLHTYQVLAQKHKCLILFLHHTGKRTENFEPSKNNLLSGQGFEAKMRLVIELRADIMNPNNRHLCIVKGNYLPASFKRESYVLNFSEDTFTFTNTTERIPFEFLVKQNDADNKKEKYKVASALKKEGLTYEEIAKKIGYASKGSITKLFDSGDENGWNK